MNEKISQKNVLGEKLEPCSKEPLTGWFRDGCCNTNKTDQGKHTVCARVTKKFLEWAKKAGNDLITPHPEFEFPGVKPGDLYIFIRVAADQIFQRQEYDVFCRLNLSFSQAALGADIEVPLLNDKTKVIKVKAGTQSGEMMRITGAGIPHVRGHGRGDQIIQMMVETPKKLNQKQKKIFQELAEIEGNPIKETLKGFFQKLKL